ncbi:C-C chemokine receptor type 4 [Engraulis encrasicolus]|uniref:C-C chemokine receptor type 4 n=1 Tax=Engraulis encrasicolus TaxID=184585 RepID=UPI002FCF9671
MPVLFSLYFVTGILGNALVVWVITMGIRLRSMTDVCLFNLSVADLLLVGSLPFLAHQARDQWVFGEGMCKLVLGLYYVSYYGGIYFITLMGIDRYLAVVHAVYALRIRTRTYGILASVVVWIIAVLSSFPEVLALKVITNTSDLKSNLPTSICLRDFSKVGNEEHLKAAGSFKMSILGFVIPLAILVFCYTRILLTLLRSRSAKRQAVRLVVVVMVAFLCCWAPYNISLFFWGLHNVNYFHDCESSNALLLSLQITEVIAYTHCCLNPVLYVFVGEKFRRHLFRLLSKSVCVRSDFLKAYLTAASTGSVYSRTTSVEERSTAM